MKNSKILITGGTGLVGSFVIKELLNSGYSNLSVLTRNPNKFSEQKEFAKVNFLQGDVTEVYPLQDYISESDYVIHCAAMVSYDPRDYDQMHKINVEGTENVVNFSLDSNVKKLIHVSSIAAIGKDEKSVILSEKDGWMNTKGNSYYSVTKYLGEQHAWRAYNEGLSLAIVNPSVIIGSGDYSQSSLQLFQRVHKGIPFYPKGGTGFVDVRDVAKFIRLLLESEVIGERFILSSANLSFKNFFDKVAQYIGVNPPKKQAPDWMLGILWRVESLRTRIFGGQPLITRSSVVSTSHMTTYDNSKSKNHFNFRYIPIDETIKHFSSIFAENLKD